MAGAAGPVPAMLRAFVFCVGAATAGAGCASGANPAPPDPPEEAPPSGTSAAAVRQGFSGSVRDEAGRPLAGALIVPRALGAHGPPIPEMAILADAKGSFAWPLPPGSYELTVSAQGYQTAQQIGSVSKGRVTTMDVALRRLR